MCLLQLVAVQLFYHNALIFEKINALEEVIGGTFNISMIDEHDLLVLETRITVDQYNEMINNDIFTKLESTLGGLQQIPIAHRILYVVKEMGINLIIHQGEF